MLRPSAGVCNCDGSMSDPESPPFEGGETNGSRTVVVRVEAARVRGSTPAAGFAPTDASGQRDFFAERLALFGRIACLASTGFLVMRLAINAVSKPGVRSLFDDVPFFHLAATAILFLVWMLAGSRAFSNRGLRRIDAWGTIGANLAYAMMILTMPFAWRADQLVLLILNAVLLGRAALVPSEPRRTAWISAASVVATPVVTAFLFLKAAPPDLLPGAVVTQATLWATFTVVLATLISNVTFHLRRSIVRARRLGQYTLLEKIGEGGMGAVYRAEHEMLRRPTAIKLLAPQSAGEESLRRFEREAQLTARLTNPHTVSVYDFGRTPEGAFYYVMEYLDGFDLERLVRKEGPLPPGRVVHILRQVCEALAEAHSAGLVHRDIKPANILLSELGGISDFAKVLDFGLVKDVKGSDDVQLTREDVLAGTPQYLAPETIQGGMSSDPRSDLYALGAVAYYLLTGTPVFEGRPIEVIQSHLQRSPEPPSARLGRRLPAKLESVVLDCLEKDPSIEEARRWWRARKTA